MRDMHEGCMWMCWMWCMHEGLYDGWHALLWWILVLLIPCAVPHAVELLWRLLVLLIPCAVPHAVELLWRLLVCALPHSVDLLWLLGAAGGC